MTTSTAARESGTPAAASEPTRDGQAAPPGSSRIEGLDGLRALAIVSVLVFHLEPAWLPGGFLGVDVFFVVSGFLITTLLVREHRSSGRVALGAFWVRRARRLVPALVLTVVVSTLIARLVSGDLLVHIGRQIVGALTFSTNWVEIAAGSSYFDQTAPQLFMNFWSLAVEEQFYLVWPLVVVLLVQRATALTRVRVAAVLGVSSALLMALLHAPGESATRVYYGTDTHAMGLMTGAALAFAWASPAVWRRVGSALHTGRGRLAVPVAGAVLLAELLLLDEGDSLTFRGGILLACLATAVLVAGILDPAPSPWHTMTRNPVATWIGLRSYALYLWHWPVILIVGQDNPSAPGTSTHVLTRLWCVLVTLALADLTHRFVELPFRRLGFRGVGRRVLGALLGWSRRTRQVVAATTATAVVVLAVVVLTAPDKSATEAVLEANAAAAARAAAPTTPAPARSQPATSTAPRTSKPSTKPTSARGSKPATAPPGARTGKGAFAMPKGSEIDAYGDSMMVGSVHALAYYFPGVRVDARSNRSWSDGLTQVRARGDGNRRAVVLAFGTNFGVDEAKVEAVVQRLGPHRMVVLVNLMAPFARVDRDNEILAAVASRHPNVVVADWASAVRDHPEQLQADRIHPSLPGSHLFAKTVRAALAQLSERRTGVKVVLKDLPMP